MNECINLIKLVIVHNKKGFIIKKNKKNINILKAFIKINIIKFIKIETKNILAYINYVNKKPIFRNIINLYKSSNKKYISLKNLNQLNYKNNWILILSTNKGIINNIEASNMKIGGLLLAKIWN